MPLIETLQFDKEKKLFEQEGVRLTKLRRSQRSGVQARVQVHVQVKAQVKTKPADSALTAHVI